MEEVGGAGRSLVDRQRGGQAIAALGHGPHGSLELSRMIQGHIQRFQAGRRQGVGQLECGELRDQGRIAQQVADAPGGGGQGFAECAQQHHVRVAIHGEAVGGRAEFGVGLIKHHQGWLRPGGSGGQQGLQRLGWNPGARGIVGEREPDLAAIQRIEPGLQREACSLGHQSDAPAVPPHQQWIEAEPRVGNGDRVLGAEAGHGHQIQQGAG